MKGQTSMVAIVIAMVLVMFIIIFLMTGALSDQESTVIKMDHRDLYANSLLLSLLATETSDGLFSDMLKDAYFGSQENFGEKAPVFINYVLNATGHTDYDWLIEAEPKDFVGTTKQWGNSEVTDTPGYWDARTILTRGGNQLEVKLYIRTK
jgi:hypothetical protein